MRWMLRKTPRVSYGDDGPVFERVCPKCRRFIAFPKEMWWGRRYEDMGIDFAPTECKRCGPIDTEQLHVGWAGDFWWLQNATGRE